jgi:hypothetical protein
VRLPQGAVVLLPQGRAVKRPPKSSPAQLAYAAAYRAAHRERLRQYAADYYARNREAVLAKQHEAAVARDRARLYRTPRCAICDKPLTVAQVRRGTTCGDRPGEWCATYRWRWFVKAAA